MGKNGRERVTGQNSKRVIAPRANTKSLNIKSFAFFLKNAITGSALSP